MTGTAATRSRAGAIHPRFRARRIAVRRSAGRRRLRRVMWLVALVALLAVAYLLTRSPLLDLDHVRVAGAARTDPAAIIAAGNLSPGRAMTDLDIGRTRRAIAALPWVDTVQVTRKWPGTVEVTVTERRPVAVLATETSGWLVLDTTGRVLEASAERPVDLPVLTSIGEGAAPGGVVDTAQPALALAGYLTADLRPWFRSITTNPDGTLEADLASDIHVVFGSQVHLRDKTIGLATVLTRVDLRDLDRIDLRVPSSPVLTRRSVDA